MKKLIWVFILVILINGCGHGRKQKIEPYQPHEPPVENFSRTPKEDAKLFQTIGLGSFQGKDWAEAKFYFNKAVTLDRELYISWYYLGLLNMDNPGGYKYLEKAIEAKPGFPLPYYWMAYYHCRIGEYSKAIPLFNKYIELAEGIPGEENRLLAAKEALQELKSGKEGKALMMIREGVK